MYTSKLDINKETHAKTLLPKGASVAVLTAAFQQDRTGRCVWVSVYVCVCGGVSVYVCGGWVGGWVSVCVSVCGCGCGCGCGCVCVCVGGCVCAQYVRWIRRNHRKVFAGQWWTWECRSSH